MVHDWKMFSLMFSLIGFELKIKLSATGLHSEKHKWPYVTTDIRYLDWATGM